MLLNHPFVLQFYEALWTPSSEQPAALALVFEYPAGGSLFDFLDKGRGADGLSEAEAKGLFHSIMLGLEHCHAKGVSNLGITLEHILLTADPHDGGVAKICDVGLFMARSQSRNLHLLPVGRRLYAEVSERHAQDNVEKADVWACGVVLHSLLAGVRSGPFGSDLSDIITRIEQGRLELPHGMSPACRDLLARMLDKDPAHRIDAAGVLDHPWLAELRGCTPPKPGQPAQVSVDDIEGLFAACEAGSSGRQEQSAQRQPSGVTQSVAAAAVAMAGLDLQGAQSPASGPRPAAGPLLQGVGSSSPDSGVAPSLSSSGGSSCASVTEGNLTGLMQGFMYEDGVPDYIRGDAAGLLRLAAALDVTLKGGPYIALRLEAWACLQGTCATLRGLARESLVRQLVRAGPCRRSIQAGIHHLLASIRAAAPLRDPAAASGLPAPHLSGLQRLEGAIGELRATLRRTPSLLSSPQGVSRALAGALQQAGLSGAVLDLDKALQEAAVALLPDLGRTLAEGCPFACALTGRLLREPVTLAGSGRTYERRALQQVLEARSADAAAALAIELPPELALADLEGLQDACDLAVKAAAPPAAPCPSSCAQAPAARQPGAMFGRGRTLATTSADGAGPVAQPHTSSACSTTAQAAQLAQHDSLPADIGAPARAASLPQAAEALTWDPSTQLPERQQAPVVPTQPHPPQQLLAATSMASSTDLSASLSPGPTSPFQDMMQGMFGSGSGAGGMFKRQKQVSEPSADAPAPAQSTPDTTPQRTADMDTNQLMELFGPSDLGSLMGLGAASQSTMLTIVEGDNVVNRSAAPGQPNLTLDEAETIIMPAGAGAAVAAEQAVLDVDEDDTIIMPDVAAAMLRGLAAGLVAPQPASQQQAQAVRSAQRPPEQAAVKHGAGAGGGEPQPAKGRLLYRDAELERAICAWLAQRCMTLEEANGTLCGPLA